VFWENVHIKKSIIFVFWGQIPSLPRQDHSLCIKFSRLSGNWKKFALKVEEFFRKVEEFFRKVEEFFRKVEEFFRKVEKSLKGVRFASNIFISRKLRFL
jgi:hypothetical protein